MRGVEWQVGALSVPFKRGDTVVVCGAPRNLSTLLVLARARLIGARTIWWGQYWSATTEVRRHRLRMKLSRLADGLLFYTDAEVNRFHADGWTHPGPVGALNNGIDLTEVRSLRRSYNVTERGRNILFIGRLTEKAQLELALNALVDPVLDSAHLHVIGSGSAEAALRAQADTLGVAGRITWHGGTTDEARIAEVANNCSIFVYPGQVGLSLIHAMGYGLPCVVHDQRLHHMPEIAAFEDGATGMTFSEGDAKSLANEISCLLANPEVAVCMALRCRAVTENAYSTEGMAARFIEFLECFKNCKLDAS
jgi:glycosyltransferase involved in cell wall biosynthesis